MIILLLMIFAVLFIGFVILTKIADRNWSSGTYVLCMLIAICIGIAFFITTICSVDIINEVMSEPYIDEKITMYEEENTNIETQIAVLVESYMKYESETFAEFKGNEMALISLYPELKADTLVQQQITIHADNNAKIKALKEKKIDVKLAKWWLYFGK